MRSKRLACREGDSGKVFAITSPSNAGTAVLQLGLVDSNVNAWLKDCIQGLFC